MHARRARKFAVIDTAGIRRPCTQAVIDADRRWTSLGSDDSKSELFDYKARSNASAYQRNIESYIGTVNIPVGIAGPLRIHGRAGTTDYRVPLATTGNI